MARNSAIGLDIGKSSIIGVQVAGKYPTAVLKAFHERALPEGLVFEGEVIDADALGDELKAFMKESKLKGKAVHLGVGNQKVIVRNIEVPEMDEAELRGAIEFQAQDYIPIPVDEAVLDFQVVQRYADGEGVAKQQVLLVAAQKDMIRRFLDAGKKAGLKVAGIDVSAFALIRALSPQISFVDQGAQAAPGFAIVNISSTVSTLVVSVDGEPKFTRIVNFAFDNFIGALAERQGIPLADAVGLVERIGLPGPHPADNETYNPATIEDVQACLSAEAEELVEDLRRSLDYYHQTQENGYVEHLAVTGRGAMLRNLDAYLSEALQIRVELGNPLLKLAQNSSGHPDALLAGMAARLAVAVGLALDEVE